MTHDAAAHRPFDVFDPACPSRRSFDQIFSRWGILTLYRLTEQPVRFGALRKSVGGISEKMLSETLQMLEAEGLVDRQDWHEKPPRVEYRLTAAGAALSASLQGVFTQLYGHLERRAAQSRA